MDLSNLPKRSVILNLNEKFRPSSEVLEDVADKTYENAFTVSFNSKKQSCMQQLPKLSDYFALTLQGTANKLMAIKRLGKDYVPETGSLIRDLTEAVVDLYWVGSYYREDAGLGETLADQFFRSSIQAFLEQAETAQTNMRNDVFLRDFYDESEWNKNVLEAKDGAGISLNKGWRVVPGRIKEEETYWSSRSKRAAELVSQVANLKYAPYHQNLGKLSAYTHWDSMQTQPLSAAYSLALYDRYFNIAIGFTNDAILGVCAFSELETPRKVKEQFPRFYYASV